MPFYEYVFPTHGLITKFFKTFSEAEPEIDRTVCGTNGCQRVIERIDSVLMPGMFFGNPEGYGKPSALKRHSTKVVSQKTGNQHSAG